MQNPDHLTDTAHLIVRSATFANRLFLFAVTLGLLLTSLVPAAFASLIANSIPASDLPSAITGMRLLMLLGIAMSIATDRLLVALSAIIATARAGDPFIASNTLRLQTIGWCFLALQLCEIPGILIARNFPAMGSAAPSGDISIAGWISVLMVFALARVFAAGTTMREELEGTI